MIEYLTLEAGEPAWGPVVDGVQLGLVCTTGNRPYRLGEVVQYEVWVRNLTDRDIEAETAMDDGFPIVKEGHIHLDDFFVDGHGLDIPLIIQSHKTLVSSEHNGNCPFKTIANTIRPLDYDLLRNDSDPAICVTPGRYEVSTTVVFTRIDHEIEEDGLHSSGTDRLPRERRWPSKLVSGTLELEVASD